MIIDDVLVGSGCFNFTKAACESHFEHWTVSMVQEELSWWLALWKDLNHFAAAQN